MPKHLLFPALLLSIAANGQSPHILKDSGLRKLAVFIGTWRAENNLDSTGTTAASATSAVYTCEWSPNGKYLIADQLVTQGHTTTNNLSIYSYDAQKDTYTLSVVGIPRMRPFSILVTYNGDELYYLGDYMDHGKKVYSRTVNTFLSSSSYLFKVQSSDDGMNWKTSIEGKAVKVRSSTDPEK